MAPIRDIIAPLRAALERLRGSRTLRLSVVFLALLLDNALITVVVPMIADYLMILDSENRSSESVVTQVTEPEVNHLPELASSNSSDVTSGYDVTYSSRLRRGGYVNENSKVGLLLSSKAVMQLIVTPFVGPLINRFGYSIPMTIGFLVTLCSTLLYAFGTCYTVLFLARTVHGLGSSCTATGGLTMLAETYTDDMARSRAMGIALGGVSLGVLVGYPFGGIMYQFVGKTQLFLIVGALLALEGVVQIWVLQPSVRSQDLPRGTPLSVLLRDPYIVIASGAIMLPDIAAAMLEPTLPIWLIENMKSEEWQLGVVFLPDSVGFWIGCNVFGVLSLRLGRWRVAMASFPLIGLCLMCIPLATRIYHLFVPQFFFGLAVGMVNSAVTPLLALLVDTRYEPVYGSVYAISQVAVSLGFALGPLLGGQVVNRIGFPWLMRGMATISLMYTPLCYKLRDPPSRNEASKLVSRDHPMTYDDGTETKTETDSFSYQRLRDD